MCLTKRIGQHVSDYEEMKNYSIMANTMANKGEMIIDVIHKIIGTSYGNMSEKEVNLIISSTEVLNQLSQIYTDKSDEFLSKYYDSYRELTSSVKQSFIKEGLICLNQQ